MVDIRLSDKRKEEIAELYYDRLVHWIDTKKLWSIQDDERAKDTKVKNRDDSCECANEMMNLINRHRRMYFLAPASNLKEISEEFSRIYAKEKKEYNEASRGVKPTTSYGRFVIRMRKIYNGFMKEEDNGIPNGYWLMKMFGVKICPYCNSNYIFTITGKNIRVRPEFDHFFPEALHPSLILSFYNLVPSCRQCNFLKRVQVLDVNPWERYAKGEEPTFRVDTSRVDFPARPTIVIEGENENTKKLGIRELYNEHTDYVKDILDKIQAYNPATYFAIARDFQGIAHTEADLARMIWGNYTNPSEMDKRPLAKLTSDILDQFSRSIFMIRDNDET